MGRSIISVDDSEVAQDYIRAALEDLGYDNITSFLRPVDALEALTTGTVSADLILLDVMMPDIDGIELCARIREQERLADVPIIMLTSRNDMDTLSHAFLAGANDYVTKPFNRIELQARMRSSLRFKSELDRRRVNSLSLARSSVPYAEMSAVLNNKVGFGSALQCIPKEAHEMLALIVFRVDLSSDRLEFSEGEIDKIYRVLGQRLAEVPMLAGDIFAHWDADLFCFATCLSSEFRLRGVARNFIDAVSSLDNPLRVDRALVCPRLHAIIQMPSKLSPASALGHAISVSERHIGPDEILIVSSEEGSSSADS
ncbi:response regulator [Palleronia pelagia]|uniref:Response regulator receiver modulated diguanylate cyclase n=1 Tax=Palleronia pelagia TaxID=387096 RepID=A0A1H8HCC1_9RHOB|nr:response regulator [Palleronia pelagia]SEN53893.1 response regulator receiver modulated diguanylate cyclase [Palleronia pelagia]